MVDGFLCGWQGNEGDTSQRIGGVTQVDDGDDNDGLEAEHSSSMGRDGSVLNTRAVRPLGPLRCGTL